MKNNKTIDLINKLIEKTKDSSISWNKCSNSNIELKPLSHFPIESALVTALATSAKYASQGVSLNEESSYVGTYANGVFFLLAYCSVIGSSILELRVQTKASSTSKLFASSTSENDPTIAAQLKRLYNIIDSTNQSSDIDSFIDEFLTKE